MCGFAGFLSFRPDYDYDRQKRLRILARMGQAIGHRGPDDEQFYDDGVLSLVFRRLSIVDSTGGRQPLVNETGDLLLVCNGEIYNHLELRQGLQVRHHFSTQSDCEVLLHGHEDKGVDFLQKVRGMFALAMWDKQQKKLLLARDRLGIKPLYFCSVPDGFLFGSELKALMAHPMCPRQTNWNAFNTHSLTPATTPSFVEGVEHLPGGTYLEVDLTGRGQQRRYWSLVDHMGHAPYGLNAERYIDEFHRLICEATEQHLQGDWTVGLHLSGGTDSTLLAALLSRMGVDAPCFTLVERTTLLAGDVDAARSVSAGLGLSCSPVLFDYRTLLDDMSFSLDSFEAAVWMMDSPLFDIEWLLKQALTGAARSLYPDLKVLLIGQGADEFSGGYSCRMDTHFRDWNDYLVREVNPLISHFRMTPERLMQGRTLPVIADSTSHLAAYHQAMHLNSFQLQAYNLFHEDRTSSWHSIEARVPFLDHHIVELLASVPGELHPKLFWNKEIVRRSLRRLLPGYDSMRPKVGFCLTNDTRSIQIILHEMACRLAPEFCERYVNSIDFPFDSEHTLQCIDRVLSRKPGFFADSTRLINLISAAIFDRYCGQGRAPDSVAIGTSSNCSSLSVVTEGDWPELREEFAKEPAMPVTWDLDDVPVIHAGAQLQYYVESKLAVCSLLDAGEVCAQVCFPASDAWLAVFVQGLGQAGSAARSVNDWLNELDIGYQIFINHLNVMYQCGMVVRRERRRTTSENLKRRHGWLDKVKAKLGAQA